MDIDIKTRLATVADVGALMDLLMLHGPEFPVVEINHIKSLSNIREFIEKSIVIVIEVDGRIVASSALVAEQFWYSDDWMLVDYWTFVHPKFRHPKITTTLLKSIRAMARKTKLPTLIGVRTVNQVRQKNRLFRRYFKPIGEMFACEIPDKKG